VLTEDLNFFYRLNKQLQYLQIEFKVLNIGKKIPDIPNSIILSTFEELHKFDNYQKVKEKILPYAKEDDFEKYIIKVLAAIKISNNNYSEIIFSIDPGTKHFGLVVFLDDYYLNSHTIYEKDILIKKVWLYINALQEGNPNQLKLFFKFGRGIMSITIMLIEQIFQNFNNKELVKILLIDESKTSKYKIRDETKKKIPKDEASALIISLREGIEINYDDYKRVMKQTKPNKMKSEDFQDKLSKDNEDIDQRLIEIAENVLKGELSLSKSMELIKSERIIY
jgi:hypothetical protein